MTRCDPPEDSEVEMATAIASAITFLFAISDHAGTAASRPDGAAIFIIRDPEAAEKFLEFYKLIFQETQEENLVALVVDRIARAKAQALDEDSDEESDDDQETDMESN